MNLFHRDYGGKGKEHMILLHGLLGSSRNWITVGKLLTERFHVIGLDLRNHGQSPHSDEMSYPLMVQDVATWMDSHDVESCHLVGHSMGGKVAMLMSCIDPDRIDSLSIADIAPKSYAPHFKAAFDAMHAIDPKIFKRIAEVESELAKHLSDPTLRQFLLTNLERNQSGTFDWQINLEGITNALPILAANPLSSEMSFDGPSQLLYGETSDFVSENDWSTIQKHFPSCRITKVPRSGHNVHVENRHFFAEHVNEIGNI